MSDNGWFDLRHTIEGVGAPRLVGRRFLSESGLLGRLNREMLHPLGLALTITTSDPEIGAFHVGLIAADDDVFEFDPETLAEIDRRWQQFVTSAPILRSAILRGIDTEAHPVSLDPIWQGVAVALFAIVVDSSDGLDPEWPAVRAYNHARNHRWAEAREALDEASADPLPPRHDR